MKLINNKIMTLLFSVMALVALSGCGDSGGVSYVIDDSTPPPSETTKLVGVQVAPGNTYVEINGSTQYTATAIFDDGTTQDVTSTSTWNISDTSIAVINATGMATGVSVGSVKLAATYSVDGIEQSGVAGLDVLADDPTLESFEIDGSDIVSVGLTTQLVAVATLSDGTTYDVNDKVSWTTSNAATATVDAMGVVTGIVMGDVTITATSKTDNTLVATHNMTVTEATLVSIQIELGYNPDTPQPITTLEVPITTDVYITSWGIYSDGSRHYINPDTFWWSSDQQTASINSIDSSNVYGRDLGTATITATYEEITASLAVTVVNNGPALTAITLKIDNGTDVTGGTVDPIPAGFMTWVTAYGTYDDGTTGVNINRYVGYSSSDNNIAYVIDEIDSNIRGRSEGSAVITAEWQGVSATVTAPVIGLTSIIIKTGENAETPPPGTVIDIDNPLTMQTGSLNKVYITAHGMYTDSVERYINADVFWKSDNNDIASMSLLQLDSWVTGESVGTTQVSATLVGVEGRATVIVQ